MSKLEQFTKPPIEAIYSQASPSEIIQLGPVDVEFEHRDKTYSETALATIRFTPKDRLDFTIREFQPSFHDAMKDWLGDMWKGKLTLLGRGVAIDAFCTHLGNDGLVIAPNKSAFVVTPPATNLTKATLHLFNFPNFRAHDDFVFLSGEPPHQGARRCGRVFLETDGWRICVTSMPETDDRISALKAQGGYVITHVADVSRTNESSFSSEELVDLTSCLHYFLSFALGRWAGLALPVGVDAEGNRTFEEWGTRMMAEGPWSGACSWWDVQHGELLKEVFPGFVALWKSDVWRRPLTESLYWYLGANERGTGIGVDTGLILAQTALELLAWNYCVRDRRMISESAFKPRGLSAADKLRLLASSVGIPVDIPVSLTALHSKPGKKCADGLEAITSIRNSLVHPDAAKQLPEGSYYDAWRLSLWYIDLTLLHLCHHNGKYANRLASRHVGQVETVPWATDDTKVEGVDPDSTS